ncbi:MAG: glycosyltransferase family 39 protein [Chitinophagaceae bacterium]|nr:glycosyltransferase family 39 protein [Chitinophagaceae bacterium]
MRKHTRLILFLALARFILPYLLQNGIYEPHRDEFLYLAQGNHLAWGFLEVPPFLSVFAWLIHLFGNSVFWIRFWPDLFGSLTFLLCADAVRVLGGKQFSIWLVFFAFVFTGWLRMFFLFQPNAPEIFFITLMNYGIFRYIIDRKPKYLFLFGIAAGLGMLTKYTVAFWAFSLLTGLALTSKRKIFKERKFYFSLIIAFLIFLPNFLWQAFHQFPFVHHMEELKSTQLNYISPGDFFKEEFLMYLPVFFVWIAGLIFCLSRRGRDYKVFCISFLVLQVIMLLLHGKSYYTAGSFTFLFVFGAIALENGIRNRLVKYMAIVFPLVTGIFFWPLLLPVTRPAELAKLYQKMHLDKSGLLRWEDLKSHPLPQDFADMLGWKEMTEKTEKVYSTLTPEEKKDVIIWCDNYGESGAINFFGKKYHLPEAYSANGSFLFWLPSTRFPDNVILISRNEDAVDDPYVRQFNVVKVMDSITNPFSREYKTLILSLQKPSTGFRQQFQKRIDSLRNQFGGYR